jgi:hypothetical protein
MPPPPPVPAHPTMSTSKAATPVSRPIITETSS